MKKCYEEFESGCGACLVLEAQDGTWALPWATLVSIHWPKPDETEIVIAFAHHEAVMVGRNLGELFKSLSQGRTRHIRMGREGDLELSQVAVQEKD